MDQALINPEVLAWARERVQYSPETIANKVNVALDKIIQWETGEKRPTFRQAQKLAHRLHIPFGYLFLSEPPEEELLIPDLRTIAPGQPEDFSVDFRDLLYDVFRKQRWYKNHLREQAAEPLPFIGKFNTTHNPDRVAQSIRNVVELDAVFRRSASNWEEFLRLFIYRLNDLRIVVQRSGIVGNNTHRPLSVEEFRGFAISDELAPLIFINGKDAKAAQIFTLAHELAHLWIGASGISNPNLSEPRANQNPQVEQFCNQVAAELLVPKKDFLRNWNPDIRITENLTQLVRIYRVSSLVVLKRAFDLNRITYEQYQQQYQAELQKQKPIRQSDGGDFYSTLQSRNSRQFTQAVVSAALEGRLLYKHAANLLQVKVKTIENIYDFYMPQ